MVLGRAVEDEEAGPRSDGRRPGGRELGRQAQEDRGDHSERRLVVLTDDQEVIATQPAEEGRGRVLDRDRVAQPGLGRAQGGCPRRGIQALAEQRIECQVGRSIPFEDDRRAGQDRFSDAGQVVELLRYHSRRSSESQTTWKKWLPSGAPLASL